jgi:hypothetical protein
MRDLKSVNVAIFLATFLVCVQVRCDDFNPFDFLPPQSLVKKECSECGFGNILFRSSKQQGCRDIRDTLAKFNEPDRKMGFFELLFGLFLGPNGRDLVSDWHCSANEQKMKQKVFAVLGEKYSPEKMREEHTLLYETAKRIHETRNERKKQAAIPRKRHPQDPY